MWIHPRDRHKIKKTDPPLFTNERWQQCYESWLFDIFNRSGSTDSRDNYRQYARAFFRDPNMTPDRYTRVDVERFLRAKVYHRSGMSDPMPATYNARLRVIHNFYVYANKYTYRYRGKARSLFPDMDQDPTAGFRLVKPGRTRRALTEEELKRLFAAIPREGIIEKRDYAFFMAVFWTARRKSEILRLLWRDIFEVIFVEDGKMTPGHMYRYSSKGHARETFTAELPQPAYDAIMDYLRASGRLETMKPETPIFTRHDSARFPGEPDLPLHKATPNAIMKKYRTLSGIDLTNRQVCVHSLRHSRARYTFKRLPGEKGVTEVQKLLGHSSPITTVMCYLYDAEEKPDTTARVLMADFGHL